MTPFRDQFHFPRCEQTGKPVTYLCGHSLGLQPKKARAFIEKELDVWQTCGVEGHFKEGSPWYSYHETVTDSLAKLTGSKPAEVVAMNSLSANLHFMMASFYRPTADRPKILADFPSFPSDKYALDSVIRFHGYDPESSLIRFETLKGDQLATTADWLEAIETHKESLALVYLNPVNYLTGQLTDVAPIAAACQNYGIPVGLDLAHSIGNVPLSLNQWGVDFAIWCSYKYLNASPGGIGGAFVHERHHNAPLKRLEGWWGTNAKTRFQMADQFESAQTVETWQLSNPPILLLATLRASLDIYDQTSLSALRRSSDLMSQRFIDRVQKTDLGAKLHIINGTGPRGNMLCIRLKDKSSAEVHDKLAQKAIVLDQRKPDILRFSFCPLYNTMEDVDILLDALDEILLQDISLTA